MSCAGGLEKLRLAQTSILRLISRRSECLCLILNGRFDPFGSKLRAKGRALPQQTIWPEARGRELLET
jgi:hypothetical protein